jgi:hypothetical protein
MFEVKTEKDPGKKGKKYVRRDMHGEGYIPEII